jgi:aerobic C4-dicarboxylate transport protein
VGRPGVKVFKILYVQVLIAIAAGIAVGHYYPEFGAGLKPLADAFVNLIKMAIGPIIFVGVASGVAHMSDMAKFGRVGAKTLIYFEVISTLALVIGLIVGEIIQPGYGFNVDPATLDPKIAAGYLEKAQHSDSFIDYLLNIIPKTFVSAFVDGNLLQVLLIAILTGFACARLGNFGAKVAHVFDDIGQVFFSIIHIVVKFAPIGAFGAMAFTIGKYGIGSLVQLASLVGTFYATSLLFVFIVLGAVAALTGFSIFKFLAYIRDELLIVLGTSSSESVLPQMMGKLQKLGASKSVVGLVIPTGYSFNLDGTNIYMTLATLFLAQATNTPLTITQELTLLGVAMLTSKGASGVTGAGFITLAATLATVPTIPIAALALIVGVDRFMSECRALTNLVGNGVAALTIARWEKELDRDTLKRELNAGPNAAVTAPLAPAEPD